jgi:hypothetical protein
MEIVSSDGENVIEYGAAWDTLQNFLNNTSKGGKKT